MMYQFRDTDLACCNLSDFAILLYISGKNEVLVSGRRSFPYNRFPDLNFSVLQFVKLSYHLVTILNICFQKMFNLIEQKK